MIDVTPWLTGILSLGLWLIILLLVAAALVSLLWQSLFLWMGARASGVETAEFGRSLRTVLITTLLTVAVWGICALVVWAQIHSKWIVFAAVAVALAATPAIMIGFIKNAFEVSVGRAIGVWAAALGLQTMVTVAISLIVAITTAAVTTASIPVPIPVSTTAAEFRALPSPTVSPTPATPVRVTLSPAPTPAPRATAVAPSRSSPPAKTSVASKTAPRAATTVAAKSAASSRRGG
jgi:hypothetical protein